MIFRKEFTILVPTLTGTDFGVLLMWMVMENTMDLGETVIETARVGENTNTVDCKPIHSLRFYYSKSG